MISIEIKNNNDTKCNVKDFFLDQCKNNYVQEKENEIYKYYIIQAIEKGEISDLLFEAINNNTNYLVKEGNEIYQLSSLSNQMNMVVKILQLILLNVKK